MPPLARPAPRLPRAPFVAASLALALFAACTPSAPPSVSPPPSASPPPSSSPPLAASASTSTSTPPAARDLVTLSLKTPASAASGLRITLDHFSIEDVAPDPASGEPGYGMLIASLSLEDGASRGTIEITSPGRAPQAQPVTWGPYRVTFVKSSREYAKDATVTVEVVRLSAR